MFMGTCELTRNASESISVTETCSLHTRVYLEYKSCDLGLGYIRHEARCVRARCFALQCSVYNYMYKSFELILLTSNILCVY